MGLISCLLFISFLFSGVTLQAQEEKSNPRYIILVDRRESSCNNQTQRDISPGIQAKIDILMRRGYSEIDTFDEALFSETLYALVYQDYRQPYGYKGAIYVENEIKYTLRYIFTEDVEDTNPNFYTFVVLEDGDMKRIFLKINFFKEYYIEEVWQYEDTGESYVQKIFY